MRRTILPLAIFLAAAVLLGVGLWLDPSRVPSPLLGKAAPAFSAPRLFRPAETVTEGDLQGQVVAVNVFASWCTACREEHPFVAALAERIPVYGLNYKDTRGDARAWLARYGNAYRAVAFDPKGRVGLEWGVYGVPETYILDADGVIRHKHIGAIDARGLNEEILPLVSRLLGESA
ncbi:Thiol:disulfide interchange protein DsbE [wastewater metagenome]|uniref:Thiol:disulfide interchange protein DsbE n=2 Tax=unclassified sequences TaxID=12908 RepID=A0A5B8REL4_9ZZZZ|nr:MULTISPECIES: DsbE family thiol:disulfide interchange protein [Arhodomonas]MCS4505349.1 DsbE family thiol:disulfide interchange protein [Arhodomonas aquaeolei]QEA06483.1 thiol:disulfide interchange protein DsbE [uncultured organism]